MKYLGSKNRIAKDIVPIIQKYIDNGYIENYYEPFVGGANIIDKVNCKNKFGSDINEYLIALLEQAKDDASIFPTTVLVDEYRAVKNNKASYPKWYVGLVGFCCSFGAKFFDGYARNSKNDTIGQCCKSAINGVKKQSPNLKNINFKCCDYKNLKIEKNSLIYCDIPYKGTTSYRNGINYDEFYDWCITQKNNGSVVIISEYNMPENKFKCIWEKEHSTNFDSNRKTQQVRIEKLFIAK